MERFQILQDFVRCPFILLLSRSKFIRSLQTTVAWLSGQDLPYVKLVESLFHVRPKPFPENAIEEVRNRVHEAFSDFPGDDTTERVTRFQREGEVTGDAARKFIEVELQSESKEIGEMFKTSSWTACQAPKSWRSKAGSLSSQWLAGYSKTERRRKKT